MSFQVSPNSIPSPIIKPASAIRKTANFPPSIWGDRFTTYEADDKISVDRKEQHIKELKEEVKMELLDAADEPSKQLKLIDAIQRLGVEYHFEKELDEALQHIYHEETHDVHNNLDNDLYNVALRFRLLRQQGHNISCDIFNKFKDNNGDFSESLIEDTLGMLALYEATHLRKHGEDILDEALTFTSFHLEIMKSQLSNPLATQVHHALKRPIRKGLPRLEARYYVPIYQQIDSHNQTLLELAKMDFNLLQSLHKKELCDITRWWKDLDVKMNVPFARDRIVELYFWVLGVYFEPQYSISRIFLTKVLGIASIIDDTYDVYGTFDELELFTEAVERWDVDCKDQLPEYMKFIYQTLLDVYEEIEREVAKEGRSYPFHYAKDAFVKLVKAYFIEAKWSNEEYVPTMDEYMSIALPSSGYHATAATSFIGMGEIVTKEAFDWIHDGVPKIIRATEKICRLMDDIVSHKFEQKRGHVVSSVECYMKEYGVVEEQVVYDEFRRQIVNAWKDINEECLNPTDVPMPLLTRILNLARVMDVIYKEKDGYTHVGKEMKDRITLLLIDQIPI